MVFLYCSLILACVWFGVTFSKRLGDRVNFFENFLKFLNKFESNLFFKQDKLYDIISDLEESDFRTFGLSVLKGETREVEYITSKELRQVREIIFALSSSGIESTEGTLSYAKAIAVRLLEDSKRIKEKYSSLSIKLSLLVGLLLVVLLI